MNKEIKTSSLLSAWIFIYFIFYYFNIFPFNPIFLLYIAFLYAYFASLIISFQTKNYNKLYFFILINTIFKIIPILLINHRKVVLSDIIFTYIFVMIYIIYMFLIKEDIICLYKDLLLYYIDDNLGRPTQIHNIYAYLNSNIM
jgi:hypothetical protein